MRCCFSPKGSDRLFDLISVDDKELLPAFYYAIKDTLVCRNLETARKIAYGTPRYRVVTMDGELIDLAGKNWD